MSYLNFIVLSVSYAISMFHKVATINFICNFYSITDSEMNTSAEVSLNNNTKP
jgi:hypothetical protein